MQHTLRQTGRTGRFNYVNESIENRNRTLHSALPRGKCIMHATHTHAPYIGHATAYGGIVSKWAPARFERRRRRRRWRRRCSTKRFCLRCLCGWVIMVCRSGLQAHCRLRVSGYGVSDFQYHDRPVCLCVCVHESAHYPHELVYVYVCSCTRQRSMLYAMARELRSAQRRNMTAPRSNQ